MAQVGSRIDESESHLVAHHEKRSEKLQRTIEHLAKQQRETQSRLDAVTELMRAQSKVLGRIAGTVDDMPRAPTAGGGGGGRGSPSPLGGGGDSAGSNQAAASPPGSASGGGGGGKPSWEERLTVEVLDAAGMPPPPGALGGLTARVKWNGEARGECETMWMGPKPTWFVNNKFVCRRAGPGDVLFVELVRKEAKAKRGGGGGGSEVLGSVELPWPACRDAVLDADKKYVSVQCSAEYREVAPDCRLGIKIS